MGSSKQNKSCSQRIEVLRRLRRKERLKGEEHTGVDWPEPKIVVSIVLFFFSSRRRHTRCSRDWSSDVCSSDLGTSLAQRPRHQRSAALLQEIEDRVLRRRSTGGAAPLQELKPRDPLLIQRDKLAVDHEIAIAEGQQRRDDVRKSGGQGLKRPGPELHVAAVATRHRAGPVVLFLLDPIPTLD